MSLISGDGNLFQKAADSAFLHEIQAYDEAVRMYVYKQNMDGNYDEVTAGLTGFMPITEVIPNIDAKYLGNGQVPNQIVVVDDAMYYQYNGTEESKRRAELCFFNGIKVYGYNTPQAFESDVLAIPQESEKGNITITASTYTKVLNTYLNTPDLTNLNPEATYYVTYDKDGNQQIGGRIDRVPAPNGWYDYSETNKKWANIVTVTNNQVAYWVWIPRYVYKADTEQQTSTVQFVAIDNTAKDSNGENVPITIAETDWKLPVAFTFGGTPLAGIWVSKYEVSNTAGEMAVASAKPTSISVSASGGSADDVYKVYLDGELSYTGTLPHTFADDNMPAGKSIVKNKVYDVCVEKNGQMLSRNTVTTKGIVSTAGFSTKDTYYVTYDENGNNPTIAGRIDKVPEPNGWYDYGRKIWANLVTVGNGKISYWTYIPRYRYSAYGNQATDVEFIDTTETEENNSAGGFIVPKAFTFGGQPLNGIWVSKYEVSEVVATEITETEATVSTIKLANSNAGNATYDVWIDGAYYTTPESWPYTVDGLVPSKEYDVMVVKNKGEVVYRGIKPAREELEDVITVDTTGLRADVTYYVLYKDGAEPIEVPFTNQTAYNEAIANGYVWYDYSRKIWANIVTRGKHVVTNNGVDTETNTVSEAYWTYIPRYAYTADSLTNKITHVEFITKDTTKNNIKGGLIVPEAFTFGGEELNGIWVSKYEVSAAPEV